MPCLHLTRQLLSGLGDVPLTAVVSGDLQHKALRTRSHCFRFTHRHLQIGMKA